MTTIFNKHGLPRHQLPGALKRRPIRRQESKKAKDALSKKQLEWSLVDWLARRRISGVLLDPHQYGPRAYRLRDGKYYWSSRVAHLAFINDTRATISRRSFDILMNRHCNITGRISVQHRDKNDAGLIIYRYSEVFWHIPDFPTPHLDPDAPG